MAIPKRTIQNIWDDVKSNETDITRLKDINITSETINSIKNYNGYYIIEDEYFLGMTDGTFLVKLNFPLTVQYDIKPILILRPTSFYKDAISKSTDDYTITTNLDYFFPIVKKVMDSEEIDVLWLFGAYNIHFRKNTNPGYGLLPANFDIRLYVNNLKDFNELRKHKK